jgi:hypothetical protein
VPSDRLARAVSDVLWIMAVALFVLGIAGECRANCLIGFADRAANASHDGEAGVWISTADFECVMLRIELAERFKDQMIRYHARTEHAEAEANARREAAAKADEILAQKDLREAQLMAARDAHKRKSTRRLRAAFGSGAGGLILGFVLGVVK